jgi:hypothetical protein
MLNITLPSSLGFAVLQDDYGGYYRKKNSHTCIDALEIQSSKSR